MAESTADNTSLEAEDSAKEREFYKSVTSEMQACRQAAKTTYTGTISLVAMVSNSSRSSLAHEHHRIKHSLHSAN